MCSALPLGAQKFLSDFDASIPGFIECRQVELPEWELLGLKATRALVDIFRLLRGFFP